MTNGQTEDAYKSMDSTFRSCPYHPACRHVSAIAGRIFPCVNSGLFIPHTEMNFFFISDSKTRTFYSRVAQNYRNSNKNTLCKLGI